ncbi:site-specific integrase [Zhaonella formicivorans]|uniref:site-specific integrase n=1 Tax=Zhaonella formicivorans TaxID=2528593 RepID=UPI0010D3B6FE|nr:site-specific integrase [Zhaonella formicivorans]
MSTRQYGCQSFDSLKKGLLKLLQDKAYRNDTINNYRRKLNQLERYMIENDIVTYDPSVGQRFIDNYFSTHVLSKGNRQYINTVIHRLDDYCVGEYQIQRKQELTPLPERYTTLMDAYLQKCRDDGNRESTIIGKRYFLREFYCHLESLGCHDLRDADAAIIGRACLMQNNKDGWAVIRMFLRYLNCAGLINHDFSTIIPHFKRAFRLPSTYTEDEINRFEETIDTNSKIGKRDYAMLLLATRLGMRSGDIVNLTFSSLDFGNDTISITQEKTGEPLVLPMIPAVKTALADYLKNGRPESGQPYVFLRANAPFEKITASVVRFETNKYFGKAGIDITDKKHGPHVFRSSLASSMINHLVSYDVVRKILGHTDPDAVKHYARVDIERLREYAIEPPAPSGCFKEFLEGRRRL